MPCRCTPKEIARYLGRISGPLLDRIDMQLEVSAVPVREVTSAAPEEPSSAIRARVEAARAHQQARFEQLRTTGDAAPDAHPEAACNAAMTARQVASVCRLNPSTQAVLERACERYHLSMRAVNRTLKVARTIADLAGEEDITSAHLLEALGFRNPDGAYWR